MTKNDERKLGNWSSPDLRTLTQAACWRFDNRQTDDEIARSLGVSRRTLARWKHYPETKYLIAVFIAYSSSLHKERRDTEWRLAFDGEMAELDAALNRELR